MAPSIHYESRQFQREHENNQNTSHEIGRRGSVVSRSRSRVSSRRSEGGKSRVRSQSESRPIRRSSCASLSRRKSEHGSQHSRMSGQSMKPDRITGRERCYDQPRTKIRPPCHGGHVWDHGKYARDECGSGIVPKRFDFVPSRKIWCKTPLSMYQATIGELGRQILCRERVVPRDVKPGPPCNVCEYILPPCGGFYRKYDCLRPCEEEYATYKQGQKVYRDRVERYWEPCLTKDQKNQLDVNCYAGQNVYLGLKLRRKNVDIPCW